MSYVVYEYSDLEKELDELVEVEQKMRTESEILIDFEKLGYSFSNIFFDENANEKRMQLLQICKTR